MARFLDYDPVTKTRLDFHVLGDGEFAVTETQDVEEIVKANKSLYNMYDENARFGDRINDHHVAHIPDVIAGKLHKAGILNNPERLKRWLNDPDNRFFRTRPGRV